MSEKDAYVSFFSASPCNKSKANAETLAAKYDGKIKADVFKTFFKFFNTSPINKSADNAISLTEKFASMRYLPPNYVQTLFKLFNSSPINKSADASLTLIEQYATHRLGPVPIFFVETLFKFFNTSPINKSADASLLLVMKFFEMTEVNGWLPTYDELIKDVPAFFKFFNGSPCNKNSDVALGLCERVVKGVGRVNLANFQKTFQEANRSKPVDKALEDTFAAFKL